MVWLLPELRILGQRVNDHLSILESQTSLEVAGEHLVNRFEAGNLRLVEQLDHFFQLALIEVVSGEVRVSVLIVLEFMLSILWQDLRFDLMRPHCNGVKVKQAIENLDRDCTIWIVLHLLVELPSIIAVLLNMISTDVLHLACTRVHPDQLVVDVLVHDTLL